MAMKIFLIQIVQCIIFYLINYLTGMNRFIFVWEDVFIAGAIIAR